MSLRQPRDVPDRDLVDALDHLRHCTVVPPLDPAREARLLAAFDTAASQPLRPMRAGYWWMAALTTAAAAIIATGLMLPGIGRRDPPPVSDRRPHGPSDLRGVRSPVDATGEFVSWPGSSTLPPLESGQLLRVTLPVSLLPTLGLTPPSSRVTAVRADVLVGQDGLARAVRLID